MNYYGITVAQANGAISAANMNIPSGNFESNAYVYMIRVDGRVYNAQDLQNLPVGSAAGNPVYLKDIATIKETAIEKTRISRISSNGQTPSDAITLNITKRTGGNIIETADQAKEVFKKAVAPVPNLAYSVTHDSSKFIRKDFDQLTHDFIITIFL